jgi:hypothetical protein
MLPNRLIALTALSALLATTPALARPTGGIWDRAPRAKKVKRPKPAAETEQVQTDSTAPTSAPAASSANGVAAAGAVAAPSGEVSPPASNNGQAAPAVCTAENPCQLN